MNKQFRTLLTDSFSHYKWRKLKKALNSAQIALEFGLNEKINPKGIIEAYLLLSRIYNTNGRYQNQSSFFKKAKTYLKEATILNEALNNADLSIAIKHQCGKIHNNLQDVPKAKEILQQSLELALKNENLEYTVCNLNYLSRLSISTNQLDESLEYARRAYSHIQEVNTAEHLHLINETKLQLSQAYLKQQEYSKSLELSQEVLRSTKETGEIEMEILALRNIAIVCGVKSNYKIGMQYFLEALDKCESIGYRKLYIQLQVNIGTMYAHLYNYPEAVRRYNGVLEKHNDLLEDHNRLVVYNNLGNIYISTRQPEKALEYFEKAHNLADNQQFKAMEAHAVAQLSRAKLQLGQLDEAKRDALTAQQLLDQLNGTPNGRQINLLNWGEIYFLENDLVKAKAKTLKAIEIAQKVKDDACEIRCFKHLSKIYKAEGDYKKALEYEEKYGQIQESFAKEQYDRQFLDLEIRHAIKEKQKAIMALTKENEYQALLLKKSDQIATQNKELVMANEELKQFAYVASHDLKEPIRMIGSFTQIIHKKTKNLLSKDDHQYFDFINGGVNRMNQLLDGLLKYATVGNYEINKEKVDMNRVLDVCMSNLHIRIQETNTIIETNNLPAVWSNQSLLIQLFQNLISNAIKFTKKGETPKIKIASINKEDETIIYVKDHGIGISDDNKKKIFEIFHRLHAKEVYEGAGIGLAICQKIAQRLNCQLWLESELGQGTTFFLSIPKN